MAATSGMSRRGDDPLPIEPLGPLIDYSFYVKYWHPDRMAYFQGWADACTNPQARAEWLAVIEELLRRLAEAGIAAEPH
jgi:hypothetical protein